MHDTTSHDTYTARPRQAHHARTARRPVQRRDRLVRRRLRVAERYGTDRLTLLIADTGIEDQDLWRFAEDTSRLLDVALTRVRDGRTPWEVFHDKKFLGNDRLAPCSQVLKQIPCRKWMETHADPADTLVYIGIEDTPRDRARIPAIARNWAPWQTRFPLCSRRERSLTKDQLLDEALPWELSPRGSTRWGSRTTTAAVCA